MTNADFYASCTCIFYIATFIVIMIYRDRTEAGRHLAARLAGYKASRCLVLGLPNGGIPVGIEIARELESEFDLLFVSKITPRFNSEIGYGAVSESGAVTLNQDLIMRLGIRRDEVDEDVRNTKRKIEFRIRNFRLVGGRREIKGKTVILTDDGIASGYTMISAVETVRERGAREVVVAVPTAPLSSYNAISSLVTEIVCPDVRDVLRFAVADAYENWYDIDLNGAIEF
ncbi:MAG: hypothetical protein A2176_06100, partial [Spirochaetes bacterium RBG_13_51_14]